MMILSMIEVFHFSLYCMSLFNLLLLSVKQFKKDNFLRIMSEEEITKEFGDEDHNPNISTEPTSPKDSSDSNRKRGPEEDVNSDESRKIAKVVRTVRVLCPTYCVGSVLGKGGEKIKELKQNTGAKIQISKPNSFFPGTNERVISVLADCERLKEIIRYIQDKIRDDNSNKSNDSRAETRKKVCKLVVADGVLGKIIGKGGERINELKANHGVFIKTTNKKDVPQNLQERVVYVEGEQDNMEACVHEILEEIHEDRRSALDFHIEYEMYNQNNQRNGDSSYTSYDRNPGYSSYGRPSPYSYRSDAYKPTVPYGYPMHHGSSYYSSSGYSGYSASYGYTGYGYNTQQSSHDQARASDPNQYRTGGSISSSYYNSSATSRRY